jgi:hypothetical protein
LVKGRRTVKTLAKEAVTYTTAPEGYDWFGTATVEVVGTDKRGKVVRKVSGPADRVEAQRDRYASGLHLHVDEVEWSKLVAYGLVNVERKVA